MQVSGSKVEGDTERGAPSTWPTELAATHCRNQGFSHCQTRRTGSLQAVGSDIEGTAQYRFCLAEEENPMG